MVLEIGAALALGILVLWLVFEPAILPGRNRPVLPPEPEAPEETRRGVALLALKEIEFDRATGKLSDRDYEMLKSRYSAEALAALESESTLSAVPGTGPAGQAAGMRPLAGELDPEELIRHRLQVIRGSRSSPARSCIQCGPRPEPDAQFCSRCGASLETTGFCSHCGAPLSAGSRFCAGCGTRVAA